MEFVSENEQFIMSYDASSRIYDEGDHGDIFEYIYTMIDQQLKEGAEAKCAAFSVEIAFNMPINGFIVYVLKRVFNKSNHRLIEEFPLLQFYNYDIAITEDYFKIKLTK
jgi:hypothetical protein